MTRTTALTLLSLALAASVSAQERVGKQAERLLVGRVFELGLDQRHDFRTRATHRDTLLDEVDVRVVQHYNGVKVFGGEAIVHMAGGMIRATTDNLVRNIDLGTQPSLTATEALAAAHTALAPKGSYAYEPTVELVIAPVTREHETRTGVVRRVETQALAYHVHTELENGAHETAHTDFFVDAHTGEILDQWSTLQTTAAKGTGKSQYSGTVVLDTNSTATGFEFRDMTRGTGGNVTYDLNHGTSGTGTIYTDLDNVWGNSANYVAGGSTTSDNGQTAAVDAAFGLQNTWDMYKNVYLRNGIDGNGTATYSRVHYSTAYDNAFWSDTCFCMTYGDGSSFKSLEAMDVIGHEMSHGVCARTANLTYRGESGGLNEANSDIFGTLVEFYSRGAGATGAVIPNYTAITGTIQTVAGTVPAANYLIGEQLETSAFAKPLRYMYKPSLDGASPDAWSKSTARLDVHYSSGPANHFFFLLAHGSQIDAFSGNLQSPMANGVTSITGVGNEKAGQIWYRALTKYMTSSTTYAGARTATLSAAADLFGGTGSAEYATVNKAWLAVNVK